MSTFLTPRFLLQGDTAQELYTRFAEPSPIVDFHNHLSPAMIAQDHKFRDLTELWLDGDHYKWRAMRAHGIDESRITGNASPRDRFLAWAGTVPATLRNPLYHWTHLELARYFGIEDRLLNEQTAAGIWEECNARLAEPEFSCRGLLSRMNVELLCTTDDPVDSLEHHRAMAAVSTIPFRVLPTFRPDRAFAAGTSASFIAWVGQLSVLHGRSVETFDHLISALIERARFFHENGCRLADHGIARAYGEDWTRAQVNATFVTLRAGGYVSEADLAVYRSAVLHELGGIYSELGWTAQYHIGPLRDVNTRLLQRLRNDAGCDTIGDEKQAHMLARFLDRLDREGKLGRTILYNLNPRENALFAAMTGCFQDGTLAGKIQYGAAWWFLDQKRGIEAQLDTISDFGLLRHFVGMVTDSRSFLSFPRHEYFRRILCNMIGRDIDNGEIPRDFELVGELIRDVCFENAQKMFS